MVEMDTSHVKILLFQVIVRKMFLQCLMTFGNTQTFKLFLLPISKCHGKTSLVMNRATTSALLEEKAGKGSNEDKVPLPLTDLPAFWHYHRTQNTVLILPHHLLSF